MIAKIILELCGLYPPWSTTPISLVPVSILSNPCPNLKHPDGDEEGEQQLVLLEEAPAHVRVHIVGEKVVELLQALV